MEKQSIEKKREGYFLAFWESWKKIWEYKTLWFWGILLAFLSGNFFSLEKNEQPERINWQDWSEDKVWFFLQKISFWLGENWALALLIFFLALSVFILFLVLSAWVRGGLILFLAQKKKKKSWQENWREVCLIGKKSLRRLVFLDLFFFILFLGLTVFGFVFLGGIAVWLFFLKNILGQKILFSIFFLLGLFFIVLLLLLSLSKSLADFLVVILEKDPRESLKMSFLILKNKTKEFVKLVLMLLLALWLTAWFLEGIFLLLKAFFFGVAMVFNLPRGLAENFLESFKEDSSGSGGITIFSLLALFVSGLFNLFKLEYKIWWLEKNQIVQIHKERKPLKVPAAEIQSEELEMVKASEEMEAKVTK